MPLRQPAEDVDGDGHDLQADEDGHEMVRGDHDHHPQDPEEQERVVLPLDDLFALHVPERQERHQKRDDQRQPLEEGAEIVDRVEVVEDARRLRPRASR